MRSLSLLGAAALNLMGCSGSSADASPPDITANGSALLTENRIALNKLAANRIALNKLAANRISLNKLATNRIAANRLAANRIAANRLAANRIAANKLAANRLAANGLQELRGASERVPFNEFTTQPGNPAVSDPASAGRRALDKLVANGSFERPTAHDLVFGEVIAERFAAKEHLEIDPLTMGTLLTTEDGREVLSYVAGCALTEHQVLVGSHAGTAYEFQGSLGLAPEWSEQVLGETSQRWVSACLFARVNAHGISVQVSLRGAHPRLQAGSQERAAWDLEEGAFWGNLFSGDALDWNACRGVDQLTGERGSLADRDCTEPDPGHPGLTLCGFNDAGTCGDLAKKSACAGFDSIGTYYVGCSASATGTASVDEVITTFVRSE